MLIWVVHMFSLKAIVTGNMPAMADAIVQSALSLSLDSMLNRGVRDNLQEYNVPSYYVLQTDCNFACLSLRGDIMSELRPQIPGLKTLDGTNSAKRPR